MISLDAVAQVGSGDHTVDVRCRQSGGVDSARIIDHSMTAFGLTSTP